MRLAGRAVGLVGICRGVCQRCRQCRRMLALNNVISDVL
jgi:hypothetical protein